MKQLSGILLPAFPLFLALIVGIILLAGIKKFKTKPQEKGVAVVCLILALTTFGLWLSAQILYDHSGAGRPSRCSMNLNHLALSLVSYCNEFGKYPVKDKWCDLLLEKTDVKLEDFICPRLVLYWPVVGGKMYVLPKPKKQNCGFALNPNTGPNSPDDMVLLFESKPGWNKYGGPELLYPENHDGCNVLFNDGHTEFVTQKDAEKLKWK